MKVRTPDNDDTGGVLSRGPGGRCDGQGATERGLIGRPCGPPATTNDGGHAVAHGPLGFLRCVDPPLEILERDPGRDLAQYDAALLDDDDLVGYSGHDVLDHLLH